MEEIIIEYFQINGINFVRHYHNIYKVKNKTTGHIYDVVEDLLSLNYEYELTNELREDRDGQE